MLLRYAAAKNSFFKIGGFVSRGIGKVTFRYPDSISDGVAQSYNTSTGAYGMAVGASSISGSNIGLVTGISYEVEQLSFEASYMHGFSNLAMSPGSFRLKSFSFQAGYRF